MSYRKVLHSNDKHQEVAMNLPPGNAWGLDKHSFAQRIEVKRGNGYIVFDKTLVSVGPGDALVIPPFVFHDVRNVSGQEPLELTVLDTPPKFHPRLHQTMRP